MCDVGSVVFNDAWFAVNICAFTFTLGWPPVVYMGMRVVALLSMSGHTFTGNIL
jgi:hypothetical protein